MNVLCVDLCSFVRCAQHFPLVPAHMQKNPIFHQQMMKTNNHLQPFGD